MSRMTWFINVALVLSLGLAGIVAADQIKLKDGRELSATMLGKDGDRVVIGLPRADVASINGETLPLPVIAGVPAPAFTATDLTGTSQTVPDPKGRVTLLKFWATWCPHCRSDIPLIKDLYTRYHDKGLRIATVSADQDFSKLQSFVREQGIPYPVIAVHDPAASVEQTKIPDLYEMQGVPHYFLIDSKGLIAETFAGSATEGKRDLEGMLAKLMVGAPPTAVKAPASRTTTSPAATEKKSSAWFGLKRRAH